MKLKINTLIYLLLLSSCLLFLNACNKKEASCDQKAEYVINFTDSVKIIRELLKTDSLSKILGEKESEKLNFLINNFSPAEIAFESEVLHCIDPVVLYIYQNHIDEQLINGLRKKYTSYKIVTIDAELFPPIVQSLQADEYPVVIIMNQRLEIDRFLHTNLLGGAKK